MRYLILSLARAAIAIFLFLTSAIAILAYVPFTYAAVLQANLLPWVTSFIRLHEWFALGALALMAVVLRRQTHKQDQHGKSFQVSVSIFAAVAITAVILDFIHPLSAALASGTACLLIAFAAAGVLLWAGCIEWTSVGLYWAQPDERSSARYTRIFAASWKTAIYLALVYTATAALDGILLHTGEPAGAVWPMGPFWSLSAQLLLLSIVYLLFYLAAAAAQGTFNTYLLANALLAGAFYLLLTSIVLRELTFGGNLARAYAALWSISLTIYISAGAVRRRNGRTVSDGISLAFAPFCAGIAPPANSTRLFIYVRLVCLAALATGFSLAFARFDWNFLVQQVAFVVVALFAFALFFHLPPPETRHLARLPRLGSVFAALLLYELLGLSPLVAHVHLTRSYAPAAAALDAYAGYDVSFRVAHRWLTPLPAGDPFYQFLAANTDIPRSTPVAPVDIHLARQDRPPVSPPNIFIIVVDSLRRDYLSPYNAAVNFTPSVAQFAAESVVMQNAFTNYGGTALSEPSLWSGTLLLHKQYIEPFHPMNSLEKLIESGHYHSFVTKDSILERLLEPQFPSTELDVARKSSTYDFCSTVEELSSDLDTQVNVGSPIFMYTQPQNIHISVINREGRSVPPGESYPGFDAAYASRLRRVDACFGKFIQDLKRRNLYSNSIVVLTADHGDSLGEDGRWGHAYTIFPEIVRVPLIIHLPQSTHVVAAAAEVSFLKDITPSLYYLLGENPREDDPLFGRSLFSDRAGKYSDYRRRVHLLASSYGPVYGILDNAGRSLFIADGVNYKDYFFDLSGPQPVSLPVNDAEASKYRGLIRSTILEVDRFYRFVPAMD